MTGDRSPLLLVFLFHFIYFSPSARVHVNHLLEGSCSSSRLPVLRGSLPHARYYSWRAHSEDQETPGIEPGPPDLSTSALPTELTGRYQKRN